MRHRTRIKASTLLLTVVVGLFTTGILASNALLRIEYDRADKSDTYWNYGTILEQPFKYVVIEGGNIADYNSYIPGNISIVPGKKASVRVLKSWEGYKENKVKTFVRNDTLFLWFPLEKNFHNDYYYGTLTLIRIFAPQIISIDGHNSSIRFEKATQKNLALHMSGGSKIQVERMTPDMDSVQVETHDSSVVRIIMSYKYPGKEHLQIKNVAADIWDSSEADFGRAQISSFQLNASNKSSIVLTGEALTKLGK